MCTGGGRPIRKTTSIIRDKSVTAMVRGGLAASRQIIVTDFIVALMNSTAEMVDGLERLFWRRRVEDFFLPKKEMQPKERKPNLVHSEKPMKDGNSSKQTIGLVQHTKRLHHLHGAVFIYTQISIMHS